MQVSTSVHGQTPPVRELLPLSLVLLEQANNYFWLSVWLAATAAIISLGASLLALDKDATWGRAAAILASVAAIAGFVSLRLYDVRYSLASETKRYVLLENGLGWTLPTTVRTSLLNRAGNHARELAAKQLEAAKTYYASTADPGLHRLLDHLQESAFFTGNLYGSLRNVLLVPMVVLTLITLAIGWAYLVSPAPQEERSIIGRFVLALIPAVLSVGLVAQLFKLSDIASAVKAVDAELENLTNAPTEREVLRLMAEYNCQIAQGLPVPGWLYRRRRNELNELWSIRLHKWTTS